MKHAKLSPSASHRWLACPGSVEANASKPFTQSFHALEGTSAHALLEVCLILGMEPDDLFGKVLDKGLMPVDEDMIDGVGYALDYIHSYVANHPDTVVRVEHPVVFGPAIGADPIDCSTCYGEGCDDCDHTGLLQLGFGTSDVILDNYPTEVVALDYKHGSGISVSVKDNSQLLLYLVGMREARGRYRRYRKVVVQPRLRGRKPVQEAPAMTDAKVVAWVDKTVKPVVPVALGKNAPRVAGSHCQYCHANGNCPAQYEKVMKAAQEEFKV